TASGRSSLAIEVHVPVLHQFLLVRRCFLLGEECFVCELPRPFHGRKRGVGPDSLQVRVAVWHSRRSPGFCGSFRSLGGSRNRQHQCQHDCKNESRSHAKLLSMKDILKSGEPCISDPKYLKTEISDWVQFTISDFGFEMQDLSDFKMLPPLSIAAGPHNLH